MPMPRASADAAAALCRGTRRRRLRRRRRGALAGWPASRRPRCAPGSRSGTTLPPDAHLRDGGRYRRRRHGCFVVDGAARRARCRTARTGSRSSTTRCTAASSAGSSRCRRRSRPTRRGRGCCAALAARRVARCAARSPGTSRRTRFASTPPTASAGPTPEGAHRDGVDLVAVILVDARTTSRAARRASSTPHGPQGVRFTLAEPWSALLLDDARVIHETHADPAARPGAAGATATRWC